VQQQVGHEDRDGEHDRDLEQQYRETPQAGLERRLRRPLPQPQSDPTELGVTRGGDHDADTGAAVHDRTHQRASRVVGQGGAGRDRCGGLVDRQGLTGQHRLVTGQPVRLEQTHIGRHDGAELQVHHVARHQVEHVDVGEPTVTQHRHGVPDLRMQCERRSFRPVFVDETETDAGGQDQGDDDRVGTVFQDERDHRGHHQQDEQGTAQLPAEHRPGVDLMGSHSVRADDCCPLRRLPLGQARLGGFQGCQHGLHRHATGRRDAQPPPPGIPGATGLRGHRTPRNDG
jgi:hypothetical protein